MVNEANDDLPSRTLLSWDLTEIQRGDSLNTRERDIANVRGFRITGAFAATTMNQEHTVHLAVIGQRGCADLWTSGAENFVTSTDFFRGYGDERFKSFSTGLSSSEMHTLPINKDAYVILTHRKYRLKPRFHYFEDGAPGATKTVSGTRSEVPFDFYVPYNRQVRYDHPLGNNDFAMIGRVALVMWQDRTEGHAPGTAIATGSMSYDLRPVTVFRDIL